MSDPRKDKVHVDTPRPASSRHINIRWHPEMRISRWGPRSHRLPRFPVESHLDDWAEASPSHGNDCWNKDDQGEPARKPLPAEPNFRHMQTAPVTPHTDSSRRNQDDSVERRGELSRDNLKSHNESDDEVERGSESDEESTSSSKRSREDMEDGDEVGTNNHLKRSRLGVGTTDAVKVRMTPAEKGIGGMGRSPAWPQTSKGTSGDLDVEEGAVGGRQPYQSLGVQYNLPKRDANNNNSAERGLSHGGGGRGWKGVEVSGSGQVSTDSSSGMYGTPITKRGFSEEKMVGYSRNSLSIQYTLDSNVAKGSGKEGTPETGARAGKAQAGLVPKFPKVKKEAEVIYTEMEPQKMTMFPLKNNQAPLKPKTGAAKGKTSQSLKKTGIHRALQKQLQEKVKLNEKHSVAELKASETGSTEESEDEKENWNKVVESLTVEVEEMEPVPSLNCMLQRSGSPPVPLPVPPPFMHPWGLFPFGPMASSFPYGPCHPYWVQHQQGPYYPPPFPQMGQPVPSGVQFPPPTTLENRSPPLKTDHGSAGTYAQAPVHAGGPSRDSRSDKPGNRSYIPPVDKRVPLLQDDDDDGQSGHRGRKCQSQGLLPTPARAPRYTPPMDRKIPPLLDDENGRGPWQGAEDFPAEGPYPTDGNRRSTPQVDREIPLLQEEAHDEHPEQQTEQSQSEGLLPTPGHCRYTPAAEHGMPLLEDEDGGEQRQQLAGVTARRSPTLERNLGGQPGPQSQHLHFDSDEEEGEIRDSPQTTPDDSSASGVEDGKETVPRPGRKVYVPGRITQMAGGKCELSGNLNTPEVTKKEGCSFIRLLKRGESVSIYTPNSKASLEEDSSSVKGNETTDNSRPEESDSDSMEGLHTPHAWRRDHRVIGPAPASAPPAVSTLRMRMPLNSPQPYAACFRSQSGNVAGNVPRAQLVARIQPRRRLTLQEEVMMEGIPKNFRHQFGFPTRSPWSNQLGHHLEAGVVYPWSNVEYIDTHCHIDFLYQRLGCSGTFEKFAQTRGYPDNYGGCVAIFCTPDSFHPSNQTWQNLLKEDKIWAAFGCHPHHIKNYDGVVETNILRGMMHKKAIAFGEIGLDYSNRNASDHVLQHMVFKRQLALALQLQKPLVIHSREAESDTLDIMVSMVPQDYKIHRHCFTGPPEEARAFMDAFPNSYIGLTNLVTFPTATETHRTAREIPLDRLLLETDAPYFLPRQCPKEIRWSHPAMAVFVAEKIARLRGISTDEVLRAVRKNTKAMYGI